MLVYVDPSTRDIRSAIYNGDTKIVRMLLLYVDPSADNNYVIGYASRFGHTNIVRMLLAHTRVTIATMLL